MILKDMRKYVDKGLPESNEQKDNVRRILLHNLMISSDTCHSILMQPDGSEIPPHIESSNIFYPYFKDYVGALDGTHIRVKANPSIKKWRYTPVPRYEKLLELFAHNRANGQRASIAAERNVEITLKGEQRDLGLDDEYENFEVIPDSPPFDDRSRKQKLASIDPYGNKKNAVIDINVKEVVVAIDRSTSVIENRSFRIQNVNEKLYKALVCAGVLDKNILAAYLFLGENKEKMMLFMGCPPEKRLEFLKMIFSF
ncbi:hypothetical protein ZIOFF_046087 [Zingiber officinale]|uniref:DDE Tnp4 domain-containing protein n=1 Tax=Zingiber officinale TaxID=94328 RepID=A0A8J5L273_ZINOF|nr:hypothetical protein ZIOFF_046087 [Zingiber officinale]